MNKDREKGKHGPWVLGQADIPVMIKFPRPSNPAFFGMAVERIVRDVFKARVPSGAKVARGTGGARRGVDVRWKGLADFYAESASEMADPFFQELASELSAIASP